MTLSDQVDEYVGGYSPLTGLGYNGSALPFKAVKASVNGRTVVVFQQVPLKADYGRNDHNYVLLSSEPLKKESRYVPNMHYRRPDVQKLTAESKTTNGF